MKPIYAFAICSFLVFCTTLLGSNADWSKVNTAIIKGHSAISVESSSCYTVISSLGRIEPNKKHDTLFIDFPMTVLYYPDNLLTDSLKKAMGQYSYDQGMTDNYKYSSKATGFLIKQNAHFFKSDSRIFVFQTAAKKIYTLKRGGFKNNVQGVILFDGLKEPEVTNCEGIDAAYLTYFGK